MSEAPSENWLVIDPHAISIAHLPAHCCSELKMTNFEKQKDSSRKSSNQDLFKCSVRTVHDTVPNNEKNIIDSNRICTFE